jgi:putative transposase
VLNRYLAHYNTARPHRGLDLTSPTATTSPPPANATQLRRVDREDILGGLIHEYRLAA